jgi:hypothetical protein
MAAMLGALIDASGLEWDSRDFAEDVETTVRPESPRETTEGVTTQVRLKAVPDPMPTRLKVALAFSFSISIIVVATAALQIGPRKLTQTSSVIVPRTQPLPLPTKIERPAVVPNLPPETFAAPAQPHPRPRHIRRADAAVDPPLRNGAPVFEP